MPAVPSGSLLSALNGAETTEPSSLSGDATAWTPLRTAPKTPPLSMRTETVMRSTDTTIKTTGMIHPPGRLGWL